MWIFPIIILLLLIVFVWALYNGLVTAKARVQESWSGIYVQLKRRSSLIPNLIETVKGYAKHEQAIYDKIMKAREGLGSGSKKEQAKANDAISEALKSIFAIAESNPELKANQNFLKLQEELSDTESKIAYSRQFYNANVMDYNVKIKIFPNVLIANALGFKEEEFFRAAEEEKADVKVDFNLNQK